jgi:carbonic anhydrase
MLRFAWLVIGICAAWQPAITVANDDKHLPHWDYGNEEGPATWAELSPEYAQCGVGRRQSPINLTNSTGSPEDDLANRDTSGSSRISFDYRASPIRVLRQSSVVDVLNSGHTIQVNPEGESVLDLEGERFRLVQYHFHAPSEHTLDGRRFPMEMHVVHQSDPGDLAVVGVFIRKGAIHPTVTKLWQQIPDKQGMVEHHEDVTVAPGKLLPDTIHTYQYSGSLTTPPCSENVRWLVIAESIEFSPEQIETFENLYAGNNRPLQPLNDRTIRLNRVDRATLE